MTEAETNPPTGSSVVSLFEAGKPVVGMIHLPPLPGAPEWDGSVDEIEEEALAAAATLEAGGLDGLLVENFGDAPFYPGSVPPETVAAMARIVTAVTRESSIPVGVNVLRNDARGALAVAVTAGAGFIRVNVHAGVMFSDQGILEGRAHDTLRRRASLAAEVAILADVHVKHATPPPGQSAQDAARDLWERSGADGVIVSGPGTGKATDPEEIRAVRSAVPEAPIWVGSGADVSSLPELLPVCDGIIAGSALQEGGRAGGRPDEARIERFMEEVDRIRSA